MDLMNLDEKSQILLEIDRLSYLQEILEPEVKMIGFSGNLDILKYFTDITYKKIKLLDKLEKILNKAPESN